MHPALARWRREEAAPLHPWLVRCVPPLQRVLARWKCVWVPPLRPGSASGSAACAGLRGQQAGLTPWLLLRLTVLVVLLLRGRLVPTLVQLL